VRQGEADILLKGKTKTAALLKAVLDAEFGLRTGRLLSDVFVCEDPRRTGNKLLMITDGGVTLAPDLNQKVQIIQNAVEVAHALGISTPRVALLSAVETVVPALPSTVDAAIITKMWERGQIKGCIVDGPLALDNAVSEEAARIKGISSPVAGRADVLVCPGIEAANMLAKATTYFAGFRLAHVIVGAKAPVLIPSRSDTPDAKLLSVALGAVVCKRTHAQSA
jgi:phosphate butyryltransferase